MPDDLDGSFLDVEGVADEHHERTCVVEDARLARREQGFLGDLHENLVGRRQHAERARGDARIEDLADVLELGGLRGGGRRRLRLGDGLLADLDPCRSFEIEKARGDGFDPPAERDA